MRKFEGLIAEGGSEDRAIAFWKMSKLCVGPGHAAKEMIVNEGKTATLIAGSTQKKSFKVLCSSRDSVLEELRMMSDTLK